MTAAILVLNYNGAELLRRFLPSLVEAGKRCSNPCRVIVVDNVSRDNSKEIVGLFSGQVEWMPMKHNRVLCSYNDAAMLLKEDVLILMNNDIQVEPDFAERLMRPFAQTNDIFMVTPQCLSKSTRAYEGNRTKGRIKFGLFHATSLYKGYEKDVSMPGPTLHGGFGAFDRLKFLELGGYDDLYLPGRLEDADICFRAYKKGWRCLYEPSSIVYHEGGVSFHKKFGVRKTLEINARNTYLFMWKNLRDPYYWLEFFIFLIPRLLYSMASLKTEWFFGFFQALPKLPQALERRQKLKQDPAWTAMSDQAVFTKASS